MWSSVSTFPGLALIYEHVIETADGATVLTERVIMTGTFAGVASRLLGKRLEETLTAVTAYIARLAEARLPS